VPNEPINTSAITNFINQVKAADLGHQREVKLDINSAKALSYTLATVMTRLAGNYEDLLKKSSQATEIVNITMDGGDWSKK
jgi:hypothetical protein